MLWLTNVMLKIEKQIPNRPVETKEGIVNALI